MGGIAVVSNPKSGRNRRNPKLLRRLAYILGETGELAQPPDLDHLEDTIRDFRSRQIDVVCVNGGDGTLHKVLSALVRVYSEGEDDLTRVTLPYVGILKAGTVNTISRNIGLRMGAKPFLGHIVDAWHAGEPFRTVERNALVINDGEASGFLFGTGVLSRFMEAYYEGGTTGAAKALRVLARTVSSGLLGTRFSKEMFRFDDVSVEVDGHLWEAPDGYVAVAAGTTNDIGLGFEIFHAAKDHPDHLHVLGFRCDAATVSLRLPRVYASKPMDHPEIHDQVARRFVIRGKEPMSYMIDGDFERSEQHELRVQVGPRVRFLVP